MFDEVTRKRLEDAGWIPGRSGEIERWTRMISREGIAVHQAAREFIAEFGGLDLTDRSKTPWSRTSFRIDPELGAVGEGDRFLGLSTEVGKQIVPIGDIEGGHFFLRIDEESIIYLVGIRYASYGKMPEAMMKLCHGIHPDPIS